MSAVLNPRSDSEPEERARQDKGEKKRYVDPQITKEEVLPDITGSNPVPAGSP